jgi:hypothetical protein
VLHLNAGDVVVFNALLVHAGCAYNKQNRRIHAFCCDPKDKPDGEMNQGRYHWKNAPDAYRKIIKEIE